MRQNFVPKKIKFFKAIFLKFQMVKTRLDSGSESMIS